MSCICSVLGVFFSVISKNSTTVAAILAQEGRRVGAVV